MIIGEFEQHSPEWWEARTGRPTSSCFDQILTPKTMKPSAQAEKYLYTLAGERIAGVKTETYSNPWMQRGLELEAEARRLFAMFVDVEVQEVGIVFPDEKKLWASSPDGILDFNGEPAGLEIKCPAIHTHVAYLLAEDVPREYLCQVQGGILTTGFRQWFFMSYYPGLPPLIIGVTRDDTMCNALEKELYAFCKRLDWLEEKLRKL